MIPTGPPAAAIFPICPVGCVDAADRLQMLEANRVWEIIVHRPVRGHH
jgi:hypothetical protein